MGIERKKDMNRFLLYWLPLIIWILGIFFISSLPNRVFPKFSYLQYLLHPIAFFVLFLLFHRLFRLHRKGVSAKNILLTSFILTMIISISKECWQIFIPSRYFTLKDILIDGGVALLAMMVVKVKGDNGYA